MTDKPKVKNQLLRLKENINLYKDKILLYLQNKFIKTNYKMTSFIDLLNIEEEIKKEFSLNHFDVYIKSHLKEQSYKIINSFLFKTKDNTYFYYYEKLLRKHIKSSNYLNREIKVDILISHLHTRKRIISNDIKQDILVKEIKDKGFQEDEYYNKNSDKIEGVFIEGVLFTTNRNHTPTLHYILNKTLIIKNPLNKSNGFNEGICIIEKKYYTNIIKSLNEHFTIIKNTYLDNPNSICFDKEDIEYLKFYFYLKLLLEYSIK